MSPFEKAARGGLATSVAGIAMVALAPVDSPLRSAGGVLVLLGWLVAGWGLHRFGRAG